MPETWGAAVFKKQKRSRSHDADIPVGDKDNQLTNKQNVYFVSDES